MLATDPALMRQHLNDPRFQGLVAAASSSLKEFFQLIQAETSRYPDHCESLVRKARLIIAFRVEEEQDEEHVIDLKTGPMPIVSTQPAKKSPEADEAYDMIVSIDTRKRFLALITQEEDGLAAYNAGSIRLVKWSMRAIMKLRSLQEVADRLREEMSLSDGSMLATESPGAGESDDHLFQGYLEKQSDWLKKWNTRYAVLKWNEKSRPQLRFFSSQASSKTVPANQFVELHSEMECVPLAGDPLGFSLVDQRNSSRTLFVLRATSERLFHEWSNAFKEAIHARGNALEIARRRLRGESESTSLFLGKAPSGGLMDILLATQRVCTSHSEQLRHAEEERRINKENFFKLENRVQEADDFLIYSTIERDVDTIRKQLGWKFVPLVAFLFWATKSTAESGWNAGKRITTFVGEQILSRLSPNFQQNRLFTVNLVGSFVTLGLTSLIVKYVSESNSFELTRRRLRVQNLAIFVIWRLKLSSLKAQWLPPMHAQAMWNVEFRTCAELLYLLSLELRGLWVKTAQYLGARPDVIPDAALEVLKRLHDAVPATPFAEVKTLVEKELKAPLNKLFSDFEETALASASIGQVHVAHLLDNSKVVVKAQHPNIDAKILQDLQSMAAIISFVETFESDFEGRKIVEEWSNEVSKELDFEQEVANMLDVGRNLAKDPSVYAALPLPIKGLYSRRVLVMKYVNGAKINDLENLRRVSGVDTEEQRSNLALDICNAFACQLFIDGIFQADAHPGNILVAARSSVDPDSVQFLPPAPENDPNRALPILLDFGLTKRLPNSKRLAFSRLIVAMQTLDISQLLLSFEEMGLRLKREDPFEDLSEFRFAFRETESAVESRAVTMAHVQKAREKYENLPRDQRNPVESFPSELMLFFRTVFLLRGMCTSLNVRVKYLKTMSAWAKRAMREKFDNRSDIPLQIRSNPTTELENKILSICNNNSLVGIQVHVMKYDGETIADVNFGKLHEVDSRPVTNETLFPCLSLGQGVAQIAARSVFPSELNQIKVKEIWKNFQNDKLTIGDLLSGDASILPFSSTTLPPKFYIASMHRWKEQIQFMETVQANLPWELSTLSFAWGWTIVGLIQAAKNHASEVCAYDLLISQQIGERLGGGLFARAPETELPLPAPKKGIPKKEEEEINKKAEIHRERIQQKYACLSVDVEKLSGGAVDLDKLWDLQSGGEIPTGSAPGGFDVGQILRSLGPSFKGKEYFIDPRIMNAFSARSSCSPSCNLLSTATALAKLYSALGNEGMSNNVQVLPKIVSDYYVNEFLSVSPTPPALEPLGERLGIKAFEFQLHKSAEIIRGFGQVAFGGSLVVSIPNLKISISILVNDLTLDREVSKCILERILKEYGLSLKSEI